MKKILMLSAFCLTAYGINAQVDTIPPNTPELRVPETTVPKTKKKYDLSKRPNDHFLLQLGYTQWMGKPDSIDTKGFSRSINGYFMFDFPFKTTPQLSAAIGLGLGSDHIVFDRDYPDVKGQTNTLRFNYRTTSPDTTFFKKTKLATTYLEAPVELRYVAKPDQSDKSFKLALGVKVGTMLKGGTRARKLMYLTQGKENQRNDYLLKEASKKYFNTTRIVGTGRIGFGHFTLFGNYQFTNLLKDGVGPELRPFTVGLSIGGL
ncbi:MAG: hypothetical protein BGN92_01055 [Sphingobacteriales bacterium 41-5]|nr:MAG: hypothetical protein BGN92_01055 [Sphingobacteriales bacterium 41-5]